MKNEVKIMLSGYVLIVEKESRLHRIDWSILIEWRMNCICAKWIVPLLDRTRVWWLWAK